MMEKDVEKRLVMLSKANGWWCLKIVCPGVPGMPDRMVLRPDMMPVFIEVKRPDRSHEISPRQCTQLDRLRAFRYQVHVVWTTDDVDKVIVDVMGGAIPAPPRIDPDDEDMDGFFL